MMGRIRHSRLLDISEPFSQRTAPLYVIELAGRLIGDGLMQLDTFYVGLIQTSLFDGLVLGLGVALFVASVLGIIMTRRYSLGVTWSLSAIALIIIGIASGYLFMTFTGIMTSWAGTGIHNLSGAVLTDWTSLVATMFGTYQDYALVLSYIGAILGLGMGYGTGILPKEEFTTFGTFISILGVGALAIGLTLAFLPFLITQSISILYLFSAMITLLFVGYLFNCHRKSAPEDSDYYVAQEEPAV